MTKKFTRMNPSNRHIGLLDAALTVAAEYGFENLTLSRVAHCAGCSQPLVNHYYGTIDDLKAAVMRAAVRREDHKVLAQGIAAGHPVALEASKALKRRALNSLVN